ncbi:MAG: hypothetical protein PHF79_03695 [Candidatus Pacebacteria bacterium]|nr:hypothetical protein [Candidatus Paceibacterota bacterium]
MLRDRNKKRILIGDGDCQAPEWIRVRGGLVIGALLELGHHVITAKDIHTECGVKKGQPCFKNNIYFRTLQEIGQVDLAVFFADNISVEGGIQLVKALDFRRPLIMLLQRGREKTNLAYVDIIDAHTVLGKYKPLFQVYEAHNEGDITDIVQLIVGQL